MRPHAISRARRARDGRGGPRWRQGLERGHRPDWPNPRNAALVGVCPGHKKSYLADLTAPDERPSLPPFPHIRSAILKTSQPRVAKPTPQKSMTETTAFSYLLHGVYGLKASDGK